MPRRRPSQRRPPSTAVNHKSKGSTQRREVTRVHRPGQRDREPDARAVGARDARLPRFHRQRARPRSNPCPSLPRRRRLWRGSTGGSPHFPRRRRRRSSAPELVAARRPSRPRSPGKSSGWPRSRRVTPRSPHAAHKASAQLGAGAAGREDPEAPRVRGSKKQILAAQAQYQRAIRPPPQAHKPMRSTPTTVRLRPSLDGYASFSRLRRWRPCIARNYGHCTTRAAAGSRLADHCGSPIAQACRALGPAIYRCVARSGNARRATRRNRRDSSVQRACTRDLGELRRRRARARTSASNSSRSNLDSIGPPAY